MKDLLLLNTVGQKDEKPHTTGLSDTSILHLHLSRTFKSKLLKYCLKKSSIQQYRKPPCPLKHNADSENRDQRRREVVAFNTRGLKQWKIIYHQAQKVVTVAYRRWSFTRGSNCKALTGKILKFWLDSHLWEVVAYERWLHTEVQLY